VPPSQPIVRVLIVEDDLDDMVLFKSLFKESKRVAAVITAANTYAEGMALLTSGQFFDVVLLDYKLPDGTGLDFLAQAQKLHFQTPFVMVTNYNDMGLQKLALKNGAVEYLEKGKLSADLLERTCLYAIGLQEKQNTVDEAPPEQMMQQLVSLTRESVTAQIEFTSELKGLRVDGKEHDARMMKEIKSLAKFRWLLDWVARNPWVTLLLFVMLISLALVIILGVQYLDVEKVRLLKDVAPSGIVWPYGVGQ
jgi:CheY-like chemotaxis protein